MFFLIIYSLYVTKFFVFAFPRGTNTGEKLFAEFFNFFISILSEKKKDNKKSIKLIITKIFQFKYIFKKA